MRLVVVLSPILVLRYCEPPELIIEFLAVSNLRFMPLYLSYVSRFSIIFALSSDCLDCSLMCAENVNWLITSSSAFKLSFAIRISCWSSSSCATCCWCKDMFNYYNFFLNLSLLWLD